ncbi:MAG TPA: GAF domain-containing SpoIIE family protein phosphatase [Streptosporangiaceae bacterium]|jgi:serine phosphatase RsbU (regulator of sigma subunit)|nr:GAF domain-containing SpoIIE family protein phosphatase [Streptosporangiaceae bacterium]
MRDEDLRAGATVDAAESSATESVAAKLRDIQSIADSALSQLDPSALLTALVERVRDALRADTAVVLLLAPDGTHLVATAASGLEEEVRQGVRIPVGRGFAGRVAAERRPVIINRVDATNVINPILLDTGVRSLIGAPLSVAGEVIGVLHVGSLTERVFTSHDADLLQLAADRAAVAVQSLTAEADRAAAAALQRSLVPTAFPKVPGLEMGGRYVPGSGAIGGDWYDVFPLPSGEVGAVIGDVAGTGLRAAVIMGRMRSALRAYALESADPAEVLARLDRKMRHFEPDALATVLYAVFDPSLDVVRVSSAGHLPPITVGPGRRGELAEIATDVLIGLAPARPRRVTALACPPGTVLCLYTDGLVERRDRFLDEGLSRLCSAVAAGEPESACAAVMAAMTGYIPHTDDVALLMLRRLPGAEAAGP